MKLLYKIVIFAILLVIAFAVFSSQGRHEATAIEYPDYVHNASERTQHAYEYAVSHPGHLEVVPCYCGCNNLGHMNNLECFVQEFDSDGKPVFDNHGAYCGVCVDIAEDTERLFNEGKSPLEVRMIIDEKYSSVGPGTDTPLPSS